ncbi:MAG: NUDIX hydrolase [Bacteroides sp.]|nr:NUDIX hydrolase [Bacteroides sp.]
MAFNGESGEGLEPKWLSWAKELQAIAQTGMAYSTNEFDIERFQRVRDISSEIMSEYSNIDVKKVKELFCNEEGFQTPKLDTRAAVFEGNKILLVQEKNGKWALPGGWVDVDRTIAENAVKELMEEAGIEARVLKLIALQDKKRHNRLAYAYNVTKAFVLCEALGGSFKENLETIGSGFFAIDELPENLNIGKTTKEQIEMCFEAKDNPQWEVVFD